MTSLDPLLAYAGPAHGRLGSIRVTGKCICIGFDRQFAKALVADWKAHDQSLLWANEKCAFTH